MHAVIFEVYPAGDGMEEYLQLAAQLRTLLEQQAGFVSIERFQSLTDEGKLLSLSFWESEDHITGWRNVMEHRLAQQRGREELFTGYRIRVAQVVRDYTESRRGEAPEDSSTSRD